MLLVLAIVDFGRVFNIQETATQAARAGARLAAVCKSTCSTDVRSATIAAAPGLTAGSITVGIVYCPAGSTPQSCIPNPSSPPGDSYCPANATQSNGNAVVSVAYPYQFFQIVTGGLLTITVTGRASMPCNG